MTFSSSAAPSGPAPGNPVPDAAQSQFIARVRWMMLISGATTVIAIAAVLGVIGAAAAPQPAHARVSSGAAVGIGLGAFALGTALGASTAYPDYGGYYYAPGYYYPPAPAYYPAPYYYYPRQCWDPYYGRYYAC